MKKRMLKQCAILLVFCLLCGSMSMVAGAIGITNFFLLGDVNNDGAVTADDARLTLRYVVYLEDDDDIIRLCGEDYEFQFAMDANRDGKLDSGDARMILRMSVGLEGNKSSYSYNKSAVDAICKQYSAYGVQAAVIRDGKVIDAYSYGVADKQTGRAVKDSTKFRASSLSKLVTFATCMALVDRGVLDLDEDIGTYFGFSVRNPSYPNDKITLRMLMTHSSTITGGSSFNASLESGSTYPIRTLLNDSGNYNLYDKPGEVSEYSNFGAALVGCICELATGRCFEDLAQQYIIDPLGLDAGFVSTSLANKDYAKLYSGGSEQWGDFYFNNIRFSSVLGQTVHITQGNLLINTSDYAKVLCMLLNGGVAEDGTRVLSQWAVNEMLCDQYVNGYEVVGFATYIIPSLYEGMTHYTHTGSSYGFHGAYAMDKDYKNGVVVFTSGCARSLDESTYIYNVCQAIIYELMPEFE
ncbi:MAG: serine hydrolase [Clostridia bacterium]|nr:serine hydrolase [Clostridia bacterium]